MREKIDPHLVFETHIQWALELHIVTAPNLHFPHTCSDLIASISLY